MGGALSAWLLRKHHEITPPRVLPHGSSCIAIQVSMVTENFDSATGWRQTIDRGFLRNVRASCLPIRVAQRGVMKVRQRTGCLAGRATLCRAFHVVETLLAVLPPDSIIKQSASNELRG